MKSKLLFLIVSIPALVASYAWLVVTPEGNLWPAITVGLVLLANIVAMILIRRKERNALEMVGAVHAAPVPPHHKYPVPLPVGR